MAIALFSSREKVEDVVYEGNDRFEGYSMDLIDEISKILGFKYVFELVPDNAIGAYDEKTKKWNGMVKQLLDRVRFIRDDGIISVDCRFHFCLQKADLAICDLTMTSKRRTVIDFTS